ncbi:MAG: hypothetical protein HY561_06310 [Gemmatimonadetes bacterium]|nr:hypothetical protein [Gemmatimonadota bacterium]
MTRTFAVPQRRGGVAALPRSGFTLAEILVILAIIATLAAVLVPTVTNQITKGQTARVVNDLTSIRTGSEAFVADVHRYPGDIEDLSIAITVADASITGSTYPTALTTMWDGPYLDRLLTTDGGELSTGHAGQLQDNFLSCDFSTGTCTTTGTKFLTIVLAEVDLAAFNEIDLVIDGVGQADSTAGKVRWTAAGDDTLKYLAIPVN